jgi:hypothetical protein
LTWFAEEFSFCSVQGGFLSQAQLTFAPAQLNLEITFARVFISPKRAAPETSQRCKV